MALFNRNQFCALVSAFMLSAVLAGCGGGGGGGGKGNGMTPAVMPPVVMPPVVMPPVVMPPVVMPPVVMPPVVMPPVVMPPVVMPPVVMPPVVMPPTPLTFTLSGGAVGVSITYGTTTQATYTLGAGTFDPTTLGAITSGFASNTFILMTDITGDNPALRLGGAFINTGDSGEFQLNTGGVAGRIEFAETSSGGRIGLQNIDTITIDGGTVNDAINVRNATAGVTFNLVSGRVGPTAFVANSAANIIIGSGRDDIFIVSGDITDPDMLDINGVINGGDGTADEVRLVADGVVDSMTFNFFVAGELNLRNVEVITIDGGRVDRGIDASSANAPAGGVAFRLISGEVGPSDADGETIAVMGSANGDTFIVAGDFFADTLSINGRLDGGGENDEVRLEVNGLVNRINFFDYNPVTDSLYLRNIETITIDGGRVDMGIDARAASTGITFNLISGSIGLDILGSPFDDVFFLGADPDFLFDDLDMDPLTGGFNIDANDGHDILQYAGAPVGELTFAARNGLLEDPNILGTGAPIGGFEAQEDLTDRLVCLLRRGSACRTSTGLRGLRMSGFEQLELSSALNLYGLMSDALMQFGAQTAQGFALADLNLATGRATSLVSKDSPFSKGRIWAHKITHSGNGKGSIGLNLTGLTVRADSDYNYEMNLTQHGFDAPLMTTRLGAFNLRAVSHTMTGTIETNVAEANVSGYGAGVALLWNSETLSAHITSLAGAYEVESHTSPLNPRAFVSDISEGSFSAVNAVVSAGVADTRKISHSLVLRTTADIVWQTLSLDDFTETGQDGIIINFDKATRFTARVGAGLEAEHWFSDVAFVHETSSGGTLSSGLSQDYRQDDGTAIEMKFGGKIADLATGLTLKAYAGLRKSLISSDAIEPSGHLALNWRF